MKSRAHIAALLVLALLSAAGCTSDETAVNGAVDATVDQTATSTSTPESTTAPETTVNPTTTAPQTTVAEADQPPTTRFSNEGSFGFGQATEQEYYDAEDTFLEGISIERVSELRDRPIYYGVYSGNPDDVTRAVEIFMSTQFPVYSEKILQDGTRRMTGAVNRRGSGEVMVFSDRTDDDGSRKFSIRVYDLEWDEFLRGGQRPALPSRPTETEFQDAIAYINEHRVVDNGFENSEGNFQIYGTFTGEADPMLEAWYTLLLSQTLIVERFDFDSGTSMTGHDGNEDVDQLRFSLDGEDNSWSLVITDQSFNNLFKVSDEIDGETATRVFAGEKLGTKSIVPTSPRPRTAILRLPSDDAPEGELTDNIEDSPPPSVAPAPLPTVPERLEGAGARSSASLANVEEAIALSIDILEDFWAEEVSELHRDAAFADPTEYVVVTGELVCGRFEFTVYASYCAAGAPGPTDFIALDPRALGNDFAEYGPAVPVFVVAHEFGHTVQSRAGALPIGQSKEAQADCLAGAFFRYLLEGDAELSVSEQDLIDIGDFIVGELSTDGDEANSHPQSDERLVAFETGLGSGTAACSSYSKSADPQASITHMDVSSSGGEVVVTITARFDNFDDETLGLVIFPVDADLDYIKGGGRPGLPVDDDGDVWLPTGHPVPNDTQLTTFEIVVPEAVHAVAEGGYIVIATADRLGLDMWFESA